MTAAADREQQQIDLATTQRALARSRKCGRQKSAIVTRRYRYYCDFPLLRPWDSLSETSWAIRLAMRN